MFDSVLITPLQRTEEVEEEKGIKVYSKSEKNFVNTLFNRGAFGNN